MDKKTQENAGRRTKMGSAIRSRQSSCEDASPYLSVSLSEAAGLVSSRRLRAKIRRCSGKSDQS